MPPKNKGKQARGAGRLARISNERIASLARRSVFRGCIALRLRLPSFFPPRE
jgi:hypothetical protein